ncbi:uncharacterized protein BDZ99DRAFT_496085 [Mytilinidion resinicola]|uniref:Uncharacterized protein n=1 Tax=Mytilinidion resinicola TaxID=574789 RepID=A0A6A6YYB0_9PEZI|nr:uncharacterized protein BDZ99DRAFT_496085 [Mytilinidion resinicola]KAF2812984.1 hypothetical protein BDZ99DRAFT_496085 [Mytilinidion resinicola]
MARFVRSVSQYFNPTNDDSDHGGPSVTAGRDRLRSDSSPASERKRKRPQPNRPWTIITKKHKHYITTPWGTVERIPKSDIESTGSVKKAATQVRARMEEWYIVTSGSRFPESPLSSATRPVVSEITPPDVRVEPIRSPQRTQIELPTSLTTGRKASATKPPQTTRTQMTTAPETVAEEPPMGPETVAGEQPKGPEPPYVKHDTEIRDEIWLLMNSIQVLAQKWFTGANKTVPELRPNAFELAFTRMCNQASPEFISYVGRIAAGGPNKEEGWKELFRGSANRRALVCGLIGNALVEQVFAHTLFGVGDVNERRVIDDIQVNHKHSDGFARTALYAKKIREILPKKGDLPDNFHNHAIHITVQLFSLIEPILPFAGYHTIGEPTELKNKDQESQLISELFQIVAHAGLLSITMRLDGSAVYYWVPTLKDDRYDDATMECFNREYMINNNPRSKEVQATITDADERNRMSGDEGLVRVNCMSGCTVYHKGGWAVKRNDVDDDDDEHAWKVPDNHVNKGIRSRQLTQNWVLCRWGRPRKWTNGRPSDAASAHGYKEGSITKPLETFGFIEFSEVVKQERDKRSTVVVTGTDARRTSTGPLRFESKPKPRQRTGGRG